MRTTELAVIDIIETDPPKPDPTPTPRKPCLCRHIFIDGHQCASRALRGQMPTLLSRLPHTEVQTQPLQIETLEAKDRGEGASASVGGPIIHPWVPHP